MNAGIEDCVDTDVDHAVNAVVQAHVEVAIDHAAHLNANFAVSKD